LNVDTYWAGMNLLSELPVTGGPYTKSFRSIPCRR
jgi:hypothetical protein